MLGILAHSARGRNYWFDEPHGKRQDLSREDDDGDGDDDDFGGQGEPGRVGRT